MNRSGKAALVVFVVFGLLVLHGFAAAPPAHARKAAAKKRAASATGPTLKEQVDALRQEMEKEIGSLKNELAAKDAELKQTQQQAADAMAAAAKAQAAVNTQQAALTQNQTAADQLQDAVNQWKGSSATATKANAVEIRQIKADLEQPDALKFKGVALSPTGSFLAAESVWRGGATGGGIDTQFVGIPLESSNQAKLSEWQGSGRQSRAALTAIGRLKNMTLTGYYEADWLGTGITSNNNQSNSYALRQRQLWAQAALNNGWTFTGGQMWSLATETRQGLSPGTESLPATVDPQYEAGFVWTRQYGFRVARKLSRGFLLGVAAESAQVLNPAGTALPTNLLLGSAGNPGGLYNPTANYSFNVAPDLIAKLLAEPGWGHWELFGIGRIFRDRVFPNAPESSAGAYNDKMVAGGLGGGFRGPLFEKKVTIGLKGLWGEGVGRYGSSTIADITLRPDGQVAPLHGFSALSTVELNPNPRLLVYMNYGGDYVGRRYFGKEGYGSPLTTMSGCNSEPLPGGGFAPSNPANCAGNNKDVQEGTLGYWYYLYNGPKGGLRQGIQYSHLRRDLWSGTGGTTNPGNGAMGKDNEVFTSFRYYLP